MGSVDMHFFTRTFNTSLRNTCTFASQFSPFWDCCVCAGCGTPVATLLSSFCSGCADHISSGVRVDSGIPKKSKLSRINLHFRSMTASERDKLDAWRLVFSALIFFNSDWTFSISDLFDVVHDDNDDTNYFAKALSIYILTVFCVA